MVARRNHVRPSSAIKRPNTKMTISNPCLKSWCWFMDGVGSMLAYLQIGCWFLDDADLMLVGCPFDSWESHLLRPFLPPRSCTRHSDCRASLLCFCMRCCCESGSGRARLSACDTCDTCDMSVVQLWHSYCVVKLVPLWLCWCCEPWWLPMCESLCDMLIVSSSVFMSISPRNALVAIMPRFIAFGIYLPWSFWYACRSAWTMPPSWSSTLMSVHIPQIWAVLQTFCGQFWTVFLQHAWMMNQDSMGMAQTRIFVPLMFMREKFAQACQSLIPRVRILRRR